MQRIFRSLGSPGMLAFCTLGALANAGMSADQAKSAAPRVDFAKQIQPILAAHCYSCHGKEKQKGGLRLDDRESALSGGDSGPALEPRKSAESELVLRITSEDEFDRMPPPDGPAKPLSAEQIALLEQWIDQGASWPESSGEKPAVTSKHWAFQPIAPGLPPKVKSARWPQGPIDFFVLAKLESAGIEPSPPADRYTLIKRLYYDLIGLPPAPEEVDAFVNDRAPDAWERLVDRLLALPAFGERWGRHWLDKARYADSDGYEKDRTRPDAWRYRDWVIQAINDDVPVDRFTVEQLAGDLLPNPTPAQRLATAFHRQTLTNTEGGVDQEQFRVEAIFDRINTTGALWLGLTLGCAQCHSHKYDPVTQVEYYQLLAFFNNADEVEIDWPSGRPLAPSAPASKEQAETKTNPVRVLAERTSDRRTTCVFRRGDFLQPERPVEPATLAVLHPLERPKAEQAPTRLDLARWLMAPANPLTPRVLANHVWAHLFGRGIVRTLEDFGTRGEMPTHPDLLDWLAIEYRRLGWSRKELIRTIVLSATYRQSSRHRPELVERDPLNDLFHRQNRFRIEAELVRDLNLAVAGVLSAKIGGPSVFPPMPPDVAALSYANSFKWVASKGEDRYRRGMYTFLKRTAPHPNLITFDCPDSNTTCVQRRVSNTPLQALTTLNNEVYFEAAGGLARRLLACAASNDLQRLSHGFRLCAARPPNDWELSRLAELLESARFWYRERPNEARACAGAVETETDATAYVERAAWTATARVLLNLDELLTRE